MPTSVYVDDFVSKSRYHMLLGDAEMQDVDDNWERADELIVGLSSTAFFRDCRTWADLRPIQYKFLITRNFVLLDELTEEEKIEDDHPTVVSFNFLVSALIKCLEQRTDSSIEALKIQRLDRDSMNFDFRGCLLLDLGDMEPPKKMKLSVVIDNTKD